MRKVFLAVGLICAFSAFAIIFKQTKDLDPRSMLGGGQKANPQLHGAIPDAKFSPDGEKLLIRVRDDSGQEVQVDSLIYTLSNGAIRKAPVGRSPIFTSSPWSPDSRHIIISGRNGASKVVDIETGSVIEEHTTRLKGWSPDGKYQMFRNYMTRDRYLRNVADGDWTVLPKKLWDGLLYWSRDAEFVLSFDRETKSFFRYRMRDGEVFKLASLKSYRKHLYVQLFPSRHSDHVYFIMPPSNTGFQQKTILRRLDIHSGEIETVFDSDLNPGESVPRKVYLPRDEKHIYFDRIDRVGDIGGKEQWRRSLTTLDIATRETEFLYEGSHMTEDYSAVKDIFALRSGDLKSLYLFDVATRSIEQIYPPE